MISDAVIFEYKNNPNHVSLKSDNAVGNTAFETCNIANENAGDKDADEDSLSLVWECGNVCNSYLCESETCRKTLRSTLLQRFEELEIKLCEQDSRNPDNEKKVNQFSNLLFKSHNKQNNKS